MHPMPVTNYYGMILIQCVGADHAQSSVAMKDGGNTVEVVSEGQTYDFPVAEVNTINYAGTQGGGDTFTSEGRYTTQVFTYAGDNHITGGPGFNLLYLKGDNNTYEGGDSPSLVYTYGENNTLNGTNMYHIAN
jgi:hypothetical protein